MSDAKAPLFLRTVRGESVERTPIWVMRQAGRYLPEYREVRSKTTFLGLCKSPELAAEVTMQPIRRFALDAAIIFSDILVPVEAMGIPLDYNPGPVLGKTIEGASDIDALTIPDPISTMGFVMDAIKTFVSEMPDTPLLGFVGAPFTLAAYMIEGAGSKNYAKTKQFLYEQPKQARRLLAKLAKTVTQHLIAQVEAGAAAVQIFDSWAGHLSRDDYLGFALPFTIEIVDAVKKATDAPVIVFAKGAYASFDELSKCGADVLGVDWTVPMDVAAQMTGNRTVLQGNLDPCVLLGPVENIERQVQRILNEATAANVKHVFNLGHGILPPTPPEHMAALVDAVKRNGRRRGPAEP